jgi:restriction endonuclease Mrr
MPLPDRQTIKMTLLNHLGDGRVHRSNEIEDALIRHFALAPEDLAEVTKAGRTNNIVAAQYRLLRTRRIWKLLPAERCSQRTGKKFVHDT